MTTAEYTEYAEKKGLCFRVFRGSSVLIHLSPELIHLSPELLQICPPRHIHVATFHSLNRTRTEPRDCVSVANPNTIGGH
jgi:hypothetical protein